MTHPGRNDPCPCGSGKKYKHCHLGKPDDFWGGRAPSPPGIQQITERQARELLADARAIGPLMNDPFGIDFDPSDYKVTPLEEAWELVDEAWFEPDFDERKRLAKSALKCSKDCAGAYLILGQAEVKERKRVELFTQAITVARKVLAPATLEELASGDWEEPEVETAMNAYLFRAIAYYTQGMDDTAVAEMIELAKLDLEDRLRTRAHLVLMLIDMGREKEADRLARRALMSPAPDPLMGFASALARFRQVGDSVFSRRALAEAIMEHPEITRDLLALPDGMSPEVVELEDAILSDFDDVPLDEADGEEELPYSPIDDTPDLFLVFQHLRLWAKTEGALDWAQAVKTAGPQIRFDNGNLGAGPALYLVNDLDHGFELCPECHQTAPRASLSLVLELITGELVNVDLQANRCPACDVVTVEIAQLIERLGPRLPSSASGEFVPLGYISQDDRLGHEPGETDLEWLRARLKQFRSLDDGDGHRTSWPTIEELDAEIIELARKASVRGLIGPKT